MYRVPINCPSYSFNDFAAQRRNKPKELEPEDALAAIKLRMKHVVDECPQRSVIFEVEHDTSEDALVKVVDKLISKFAQIDVMIADGELHHLVVERLKKELRPTTVETKKTTAELGGAVTTMTGNWSDNPWRRRGLRSNDYSLTIGTLSHLMRAEFERDIKEERERVVKFEGFERDLKEEKEEKRQKRVAVLYRTDTMLDGRGIIDSHPVDSVELHITSLLCQVYLLVDVHDDEEVLRQLREFIKKYSDPFVHRFVDEHLLELIESAKAAKKLVQGTHFGFVRVERKTLKKDVVVTSLIESEHLAIRQLLQLQYGLTITPLRVATLRRSPLHLLKAYGRLMGVFRRGGYELREWIPFMTQLQVYPSRVYPYDNPVTPLISVNPSGSIDEWIEEVDKLWLEVRRTRRIPQGGVRLVVCASVSAMLQLWRYMKYSHNDLAQLTWFRVCTGCSDHMEETLFRLKGTRLTTVLTTAVHFEKWHTRYLSAFEVVTVYLGTPSKEVQYLHRAYRFARPVKNVVTVPLDLCVDRTPKDSGMKSGDSKGEDSGPRRSEEAKEEKRKQVDAIRSQREEKRTHWLKVFVKEMWGKGDWMAPLSCAEDDEYEKCVEWMRKKWKEERVEQWGKPVEQFDEWRDKMMEQYRREKE